MRYHNITHDDMLNGEGLRVVLWTSGCDHKCKGCQNPQTWNCHNGIEFDIAAKDEIFEQLEKDYIDGITFSGGDPLHQNNVNEIFNLILEIKALFPNKSIWLYSGSTLEEIFFPLMINKPPTFTEQKRMDIILNIDVLVDGEFKEELADSKYPWAGSTNQRVINIERTLETKKIVLWNSNYVTVSCETEESVVNSCETKNTINQ